MEKKNYGYYYTLFELFERFGTDDCEIYLIKQYDISDKDDEHLYIYEAYHILIRKNLCVNKELPGSDSWLYPSNKEWNKALEIKFKNFIKK